MSIRNPIDWNEDKMRNGRAPEPTRQLDRGEFRVSRQRADGKKDAGRVFVEGAEGSSTRIEHWVLSEEHASPRMDQSMVVEHCEGQCASLGEFFRTMRERSQTWSTVTYVKATCEYASRIPDNF